MNCSRYRRKEEVLYVLVDRCVAVSHTSDFSGRVCAVSQSLDYINTYMKQFPKTFTHDRCIIETITDKYKISKIYGNFVDTLFLEEFGKDIILTTLEVSYYVNELTKVYEDMKNMISQLMLNERLIKLTSDELIKSHEIFTMYYDKCKTFQDFISNISLEMFMKDYLIEPIMCRESLDMTDNYKRYIGLNG